jgi:hypothetical protein
LDRSDRPHISYRVSYEGTGTWSALKYAVFRVTPQLSWADPNRSLLLPPKGTTVTVNYGNIPAPAVLTATLSGPAVFADGSQALTADVTSADGSYTFDLRPAADAARGASFTLEVTLAGLRLERAGVIVQEWYLPLLLKRH